MKSLHPNWMDGMQDWPEEAKQHIHKLEDIISDFEKRLTTLEQENQALKRKNQELKQKITKLENKLRTYENPHTPPSQQRFKKRTSKSHNGKRGAPKGHTGVTRRTQEPDEIILVTEDYCPDCGCSLGPPEKSETVIIEDLPPPQKIVVKKYELHTYTCSCCGHHFTTQHEDCPKHGVFGIGILTYVTMHRFHLRGVLRRIQDLLRYLHHFGISVTGIHDILLRVGMVCKKEYFRMVQRVQSARWRYTDETGFHVNGEKWWLWNFRTDQDESLAVIRKSRGRNVLKELYGKKPPGGADVTDGWRAYTYLEHVQRCWAHLLREIDDYKEKSDNGKRLSEEMHQKYKQLKVFLGKDPPLEKRKQQKDIWDQELAELVETYSRFTELQKPVKYIKFGLGCWYTCLLYPGMEPTNNLGEQAIREHVVMRKIIGTFRSERGSEYYQYIASMFATWRLQGKNIADELENLLRRELCLS